jgi:hypothetical protein
MHAMERSFKVFLEGLERSIESIFACDENIVPARAGRCGGDRGDGGFQATSNAVSFHCTAHSLSDRKAKAGRLGCSLRFKPRFHLQNKRGRQASRPAPYAQEFRSLLEGGEFHGPTRDRTGRRSDPVAARPTVACDPWRDDGQEPSHRLLFPCACGSRAGACAQACSVDTCASRYSPSGRCACCQWSTTECARRNGCQFNGLPELHREPPLARSALVLSGRNGRGHSIGGRLEQVNWQGEAGGFSSKPRGTECVCWSGSAPPLLRVDASVER